MRALSIFIGIVISSFAFSCDRAHGVDRAEVPADRDKQSSEKGLSIVECLPCNGHKFEAEASTPRTEYNGKTYYFCSDACKETFLKDPTQYVKLMPATMPATAPSTQPIGISKNAWEEDLLRKEQLDQFGDIAVGKHVVVRVPAGSIESKELEGICMRFDRGIAATKAFINDPGWNYKGDARIYFYCPDAKFICHAPGGNSVFIPLWRVKEDKSPWLHESVHLLIAPDAGDWLAADQEYAIRRMPLWLIEGLADMIAMEVSRKEGFAYYSPLFEATPDTIDTVAMATLGRASLSTGLGSVGGRGKPDELFGENRQKFAAPFYAASASFVHYIASKHGYETLIAAARSYDRETETLEASIRCDLKTMKTEWLAAIGFVGN